VKNVGGILSIKYQFLLTLMEKLHSSKETEFEKVLEVSNTAFLLEKGEELMEI